MAGPSSRNRLLSVASGGGHWDEMILMREAFADFDIVYASTIPRIGQSLGIDSLAITDFNRNTLMQVIPAAWEAFRLVRQVRPAVIVSTGAAPGLLVLLVGRLLGVRTVWLDSVANAEQVSLSGRIARTFVDLHCVQWDHLTNGGRSKFLGRLL